MRKRGDESMVDKNEENQALKESKVGSDWRKGRSNCRDSQIEAVCMTV